MKQKFNVWSPLRKFNHTIKDKHYIVMQHRFRKPNDYYMALPNDQRFNMKSLG